MLKNLKLGAKIATLTYVLIFLSGLVAFVGYQGLSSVVSRVNTADSVKELNARLLYTRQQEKDFIITGQKVYADAVMKEISNLKSLAQGATEGMGTSTGRKQMLVVTQQLAAYEKGFLTYQDLEHRKADTVAEMQHKAQETGEKIAEIRAGQQQQLMDTRSQSERALNEMVDIAFDADLSIKFVLEAKLAAMDYVWTQKEAAFNRSVDTINGILDIVDRILPKMTAPEEKAIVNKMGQDSGAFVIAFQNYKLNGNRSDLAKMNEYAASMEEAAQQIRKQQRERLTSTQNQTGATVAQKLRNSDDANKIIRWFLDARRDEKNYILTKDAKYRKSVNEAISHMLNLGEELMRRIQDTANAQQIGAVIESVNAYKEAFGQLDTLLENQTVAHGEMMAAAGKAQNICDEVQDAVKQRMLNRISGARGFIVIGAFIAIVFGMVLGFIITRSIHRGVFSVIDGLSDGADQVAAGSGEVASSSQSLAAGASEQAAGIEEISSAMEEMSSMTKSSADHADEANQHMQETKGVVSRANESMGHLTDSIEEISKASEETSKIIKTIDEIAFQTNLLALNAAVEAARAGEAGAGFAVVAEEVRNLAMRAAEAAKDTEGLIESIVTKIQEGSGFVDTTSSAFKDVTESAEKVAAIVAEIAESAGEQARGIEQVNASVFEVDKVTQQNAANAEESASASEQMAAQAEHMKKLVQDLIRIVGSRNKKERFGLLSRLSIGNGAGRFQLPVRFRKKAQTSIQDTFEETQPGPQKMKQLQNDDLSDF